MRRTTIIRSSETYDKEEQIKRTSTGKTKLHVNDADSYA